MNKFDSGTSSNNSSKENCDDTHKVAKKGFFARRFSKKLRKKGSRNEEKENYVEEDISVCSDEINDTVQERGIFNVLNPSKQKENSTKIIGKTVLLTEEEHDEADDFCPKKTEKIHNAESFVAQKIEQMQKKPLTNEKKMQVVDIESTEIKTENNESTHLFNSRGVMAFDGMAEDEALENELILGNTSNDNEESKKLNFIKAPTNYDPVTSGFYNPTKKEKPETTVEETESIEDVKQDRLCCAVWD